MGQSKLECFFILNLYQLNLMFARKVMCLSTFKVLRRYTCTENIRLTMKKLAREKHSSLFFSNHQWRRKSAFYVFTLCKGSVSFDRKPFWRQSFDRHCKQRVLSMKYFVAMNIEHLVSQCHSTKCWLAKCQLTKCQLTKCQSAKCWSTKCKLVKCQLVKRWSVKPWSTKCKLA